MEKSESYEKFEKQENGSFKKQRKKRRSKIDFQGEMHKCKYCEKSYLSEIALNSHIKTKHSNLIDVIARGRGRPRRKNNTGMYISIFDYKEYFTVYERMPTNDVYDVVVASRESLLDLYENYKQVIFQSLESIDNFPLIENKGDKTCDAIFWNYLTEVSKMTNRDYFDSMFKLIILFRQFINERKKSDQVDYTAISHPQDLPEFTNDFVSEFLDDNDYFGLDSKDIIDIIQHFCHWLWVNKYTINRLTLIN